MRQVTVLSTITVLTRSPTSAVSPPVDMMLTPRAFISSMNSCVPLMMAAITSPGIRFLLRPMVDDSRMLSVAPTHSRSSMFITTES